jgi:FkbM family methyltransferase
MFAPVEIDGRIVEFAVDPHSSDPIAQVLVAGSIPADPPSELWRHLVKPSWHVVDAGAHLGTYSLPAAAAGAQVLAVEASPTNAGLLRAAARRNSFANLHIIEAAAAARAGSVAFTSHGPWGHVAPGNDTPSGQTGLEVRTVVLEEAIHGCDWKQVDLIKIDVEGSELEALAGLAQILDRIDAPPVLVEANGHMLHAYEHTPGQLLTRLEQFGYKCHLIDPGTTRRLVPVDSADPQPECVADYLAFKTAPTGLGPWWIDDPFKRAEIVRRVVATCRDGESAHRQYGARLLASAPAWLLEDETIRDTKRVFDHM